MNKIESALYRAISEYPDKPIVIAYSGGVDSQVLLHALAKLKHDNTFSTESLQALATPVANAIPNNVIVCHVNHGLSDNAQYWQQFATEQCQQVSLPLTICAVNVQPQAQCSLEALARDARYQALQQVVDQPSIILTGHHSDDQAETFLLSLKRGSGLKGLSAMAGQITLGEHTLIRPLLAITRQDIVDYANQQQLTWIDDESNLDTSFDRNFIRQQVMPLLIQRWPSIGKTINRSSDHCREGQVLLEELAEGDLTACCAPYSLTTGLTHESSDNKTAKASVSATLAIEPLTQLSRARFNNLIRYYLAKQQCLMPSTEQLTQLHQQLAVSHDKNPAVKVGEHYFRRYQGKLYLTLPLTDVSPWAVELDLQDDNTRETKELSIDFPDDIGKLRIEKLAVFNRSELNASGLNNSSLKATHLKNNCAVNTVVNSLTETLTVLAPQPEQRVSIQFSHHNPKCLPDYRNHSRSLKKVLQELNIPPWQRKRIPFLYYGDVFVAALGIFVCQDYLAREKEPSVTFTWR